MKTAGPAVAVAVVGLFAGSVCGAETGFSIPDSHSFAQPNTYQTRHVDLVLDVDFKSKIISGTAELTVEKGEEYAADLILDTRDLVIRDAWWVRGDGAAVPLDFRLGPAKEHLGRALHVKLAGSVPASPDTFKVRISYQTHPAATGLQWLEPAQTAGGEHPFLFTQSQAVHARSWIPLQDTPQVRVTYSAVVHTPQALRAVMSADNDPAAERNGEYRFSMPQAVPSYLIALAVGNLQFKAMGERTGVYAEPELLEAAAREFEDTEKMLETSEGLFGPYAWDRYDLLILPPSFPFGGMENPKLSFITPTVIAGDKSLVALIAHELAHSWSGNLVTNATWEDLWLNEGFTVFFESRIMEALYGPRRKAMEDVLGYQALVRDFDELDRDDERLAVDLEGRDPDDAFSNVPYEKGRLLLVSLEQEFGREVFDEFLRGYFQKFAFRSVSTAMFLDYLTENLLDARPGELTRDDVEEWIAEPGLPDSAVLPQSNAFELVDREREAWLDGDKAAGDIQSAEWTVHEWLYFLNELPLPVDEEHMADLESAYSLSKTRNNEIAHSWFLAAIASEYEPAYERLEKYLVRIGRVKLIKPLYRELVKTGDGRKFAERIYARARPGYHPLTVKEIDAVLAE